MQPWLYLDNGSILCSFGSQYATLAVLLPWEPNWISESNDSSNSEFPCCPYPSNQVWIQSDVGLGKDGL